MKRLVLALALALALPANAQQLKDGAVSVQQSEEVVTVLSVDQQKRTVTIRHAKGNAATLDVPPESQNLDRIKPGDRFRMKIIEAVAVGIKKGGEPAQEDKRDVTVSPKGGTPGGMIVKTQTRSVVVDAIDYGNRYIAVRGTSGQTLALKVADGVPIEQLAAGDRITVIHTQALAVELEPQPAKKPAPKK